MTPGRARLFAVACALLIVAPGAARAISPSLRPQSPSKGRHAIADGRAEMVLSSLTGQGLPLPGTRVVHPPQSRAGLGSAPAESSAGSPRLATTSTQVPSPSPGTTFAGLADDAHTIPPDTNGAVGPTQVVTALNTHVRVQNRTGGILSTVTLSTFWSSLGATEPFDPRTRYDPYASRWIMTSAAGSAASGAAVLVAVSKTSDAMAGWHQWRVNVPSGYWADYPTLGFNKNWIVVQANIHNSGDAFDHSAIYAFGKSSLYAGGFGSYASFSDAMGATQFPVTTYSTTFSTMYLIENFAGDLGGSGALRVSTITGPVGGETYTGGALYPMVTATWADSAPGEADLGPQAGSSRKINLGDARIQSAVWRNGTMWAAHTVFLPSSAPNRSAVQWWQIGARGDIVQRGRVDDSSGSVSYAYPGMAVNKNNDVLLGYSRFTPSTYPSANYSLRSGNDALGLLRGGVVFKAGEGPYYKTNGTPENRWGDYSAAAVDPTDDSSLWTVQQYAASSNRWATWWSKVVPPAPSGSPLISIAPSPLTFEARLVDTPSPAKQITIKNVGAAQMTINSVSIGGTHVSDFSKAADPCTGQALWPGMSCVVDVVFTPKAAGSRTATLTMASTATANPISIQLNGTGIVDSSPPASSFRTENGAITLGFPGQVFGQSTDNYTGVKSVSVKFVSENWTQEATAALQCTAGGLSCTWSAYNPIIPGTYVVRAWAVDNRGNTESPGPSITVTVV